MVLHERSIIGIFGFYGKAGEIPMGKLDIDSKQYFGIAKHFADAFNFLVYDGKQVIDPANLRELDAVETAVLFKDKDRDRIQKQRDLLRALTDGKAVYVILGSELQSEVHYGMPVKNGQYDMMNYAAQVEKKAQQNREEKNLKPGAEYLSGLRKGDKLIPVITAVIYTGSKPWDGPLSLHDMLDFADEEQKALVPDYKLNIISAADLDDSEFDKFHTEVGFALKLLKHKDKDADKVIEERNHEKVSPETAFYLKGAANLDLDFEIEEGGVDMCASLERKEKKDQVTGAIIGMQMAGMNENDIISKIIERFNVTKEYVQALLAPKVAAQ